MRKLTKRLTLGKEVVRLLASDEMRRAMGGQINNSRLACTTSATRGDTDCLSEATGCESICENSCINQSCTLATEPGGA